MIQSRVTTKAQTTIPRAIRAALGVEAGDELVWEVEGNRVIVTRVETGDEGLAADFSAFAEWSDALDEAYDDL
jgi:antitoxin PrlF